MLADERGDLREVNPGYSDSGRERQRPSTSYSLASFPSRAVLLGKRALDAKECQNDNRLVFEFAKRIRLATVIWQCEVIDSRSAGGGGMTHQDKDDDGSKVFHKGPSR